MKINITKAEYKALIELLYMGDWMANAFTIYSNDEPKEYTDLIQKIYSYAKQMGHEEDIEYAKEYDQYFPTRKFEMDSNVTERRDNYDNESFWQNLIDRMSERDICKQYKVEALHELTIEERFKALGEIEPIWEKEFTDHGIDRLQVFKK
jgi:hypothetical protein